MVPFNAWSLAKASNISYKTEEEVKRVVVESWGFEGIKTFGFKSDNTMEFNLTQAFVAWNSEIVLVCYRGTESSSRRDWVNNANVTFVKNGPFGGSIHNGFHVALQEVCEDTTILEKMIGEAQKLSGEGRALYLTGHSLGGALATITAGHLLERGVRLTGLYTYGSPRVGDAEFARAFTRRAMGLAHRFVNHRDGVARLPFRQLGYRHVGELWYINGNQVISNASWFRQVWDVMTFDVNGEVDFAADHSLDTGYIPSLWRAVDEQ